MLQYFPQYLFRSQHQTILFYEFQIKSPKLPQIYTVHYFQAPSIYPFPKLFSPSDCRVSFNFGYNSFLSPYSFLFFSLEFIFMSSSIIFICPFCNSTTICDLHRKAISHILSTCNFVHLRYCLVFHFQNKCGQSDLYMGHVTRTMLSEHG